MVACHTGIYAGLVGKDKAPHTWEAYHSNAFWNYIFSKWGDDIPKPLLKTLLYSGLNGASMRGGGSIRCNVKEACGNLSGFAFEAYLQKVLKHP